VKGFSTKNNLSTLLTSSPSPHHPSTIWTEFKLSNSPKDYLKDIRENYPMETT
jgi:hypothetical protein